MGIVLAYVQSCASGSLGVSECGPIWQLVVIAFLLLFFIVALLALRIRARFQPGNA